MSWSRVVSCGLLSAASLVALASPGAKAAAPPIPGFLDLQTGTFTALAHSQAELDASGTAPASPATAPKIIAGTLAVHATLTVEASIPASASLTDYGYTTAGKTYASGPTDAAYYGTAQNTGSVQRSGSTATATVTIPYRMTVDGASTTMQVSLNVYTSVAGKPTLQMTKVIPIPANGATTTVTLQGAL